MQSSLNVCPAPQGSGSHSLRVQPSAGSSSSAQLPHRRPTRPQQRGQPQLVHAAPPRQQDGAAPPAADSFFTPGQEGEERQRLFNTIAPVYDQLNDQLSMGLHRVWKRMAVKWSGARTGAAALDVCCGSGDLAFRLAEAVGPSGSVVGLDFSHAMLDDAARRQQQRQAMLGPAYNMRWVQVGREWDGMGAGQQTPSSWLWLPVMSSCCSGWFTGAPMECPPISIPATGRRHGPAI